MQMGVTAQPVVDVRPQPAPDARPGRNGGLDALRATMTLLVLFHHAAITYGASGGWFYHELPADHSPSSQLLTLFVAINQAYFMGLFFLLAGYFTPAALRSKGSLRYARDRLIRLGLPLLAFGWVIGPVSEALGQTAHGHPFIATLAAIMSSGRFIQGPLWFAHALLIFGAGAMLWFNLTRRPIPAADAATTSFPSNLVLLCAALLTGVAAFALRLWWPVGSEWNGLQLGYFASYTMLFAAGYAAADARWLERVPSTTTRLWLTLTLICLPVLPIASLSGAIVPALHRSSAGGWTWPAAIYALWEPLVAWGLILWLLPTFQRRFATLSPIWGKLADRAYAIYIIHPPVLVGVALAGRPLALPALVKFPIAGTLTCVLCYALAGLLLRTPGARRIV
ncbi:acyltransferase family protein [Rhodopseudomonas sp.]|uniref:acyltransferase family protein n=1 Tax=Rhodopseudomonas sp. TaxID=1078 RepID=UPI003B3A9407